eukprot:8308327-Pyramimonas_sp.AAC.1
MFWLKEKASWLRWEQRVLRADMGACQDLSGASSPTISPRYLPHVEIRNGLTFRPCRLNSRRIQQRSN